MVGHSVRIMPNDCEAGSLQMFRMRSIVGPLSYLLISDLLVLAIIALAPRTGTVQSGFGLACGGTLHSEQWQRQL